MPSTLDGLNNPFFISFMSDKVDPSINQWTVGKNINVEVFDHYLNPKPITWKGVTIRVADYELFVMFIKDTMNRYSWTKSQALDEFFEL